MTNLRAMGLGALLAVTTAVSALAAQHEQHQAAAGQCAQAQPEIEAILVAVGARLEAARQANSPAGMRAAIDDLQGALRDVRLKLAPCARLTAADPHAGHAMPAQPERR